MPTKLKIVYNGCLARHLGFAGATTVGLGYPLSLFYVVFGSFRVETSLEALKLFGVT